MQPHTPPLLLLPLGAKFIWGIKSPSSLDPIDIWVSISEIITASGQYPSVICSLCDDGLVGGGDVAPQYDQKGAVLCLRVCVCVVSVCLWVSVCAVLYSTVRTHGGMQRWECGSVKEWFCPFCISASGALSSAWMEVWRVTVGEKGAALFKAGFTHSSVPIWDTVPSLSPHKAPLTRPASLCSPHPVGPRMRSEGTHTGRDDSSSASVVCSSSISLSLSCNQIWEWLFVIHLCSNRAAHPSKISFIYCRSVMAVFARPVLGGSNGTWVVWGLFIYAFKALLSSSFWG